MNLRQKSVALLLLSTLLQGAYGGANAQNLQEASAEKKVQSSLQEKDSAALLEEAKLARYRGDYAQALAIYESLVAAGNARAMQALVDFYRNGWVVERDEDKAQEYLRRAAEKGDPIAVHWQVRFESYRRMDAEIQAREAKALAALEQAAMQKDSDAQFLLSNVYSTIGYLTVEPDSEKTIFWLREAAEMGHPEAQYELAYAYYSGSRVEFDYERAMYWYQRSGELGYLPALWKLVDAYHNGLMVKRDSEKAAYWFRKWLVAMEKEAQLGNPAVQGRLGGGYISGAIIESDLEKGRYWLEKAAAQGYEPAIQALQEISTE